MHGCIHEIRLHGMPLTAHTEQVTTTGLSHKALQYGINKINLKPIESTRSRFKFDGGFHQRFC